MEPTEISPEDHRHLLRSIALAAEARAGNNHPFGALLVDAAGAVLCEAGNTVVTARDPTGHAELNLVRLAGPIDPAVLARATLYTSTEPCAMCAGAIYWSGIGRVVFALPEDALRAMTGADPKNPTLELPCREVFARGQRPVVVAGPAAIAEARAVHAGFWTPA